MICDHCKKDKELEQLPTYLGKIMNLCIPCYESYKEINNKQRRRYPQKYKETMKRLRKIIRIKQQIELLEKEV